VRGKGFTAGAAGRNRSVLPSIPRSFAGTVFLLFLAQAPVRSQAGPVLAIGGGKDQPEIVDRFIAVAGGPEARIIVLPLSSAKEGRGEAMARLFRDRGAKRVVVHAPATAEEADEPESLRLLGGGDAFYFGGGDQSRAMSILRGTKALGVIRERHKAGKLLGGSSAGCALLSGVMITGMGPDAQIAEGNVPTAEGLDLVGNLVLDQHFLERGRLTRLITVVLEKPLRVGLGVDRETAVLITGKKLEVLGKGQAVLVVPVKSSPPKQTESRRLLRAPEVRLELLATGDTAELP
jgi:cyanophycinase